MYCNMALIFNTFAQNIIIALYFPTIVLVFASSFAAFIDINYLFL